MLEEVLMCQICRTGESILEVAFSLCGPREIEQLNKDLNVDPNAPEHEKIVEHDVPAFVFAALCNALARHAFQQRITSSDLIVEGIRIQWNKMHLMKHLGLLEHDQEAMRKLKEYES
jgi:hypothetical protein